VLPHTGIEDGLANVTRGFLAMHLETMQPKADLNDLSDWTVSIKLVTEMREDGENIGRPA